MALRWDLHDTALACQDQVNVIVSAVGEKSIMNRGIHSLPSSLLNDAMILSMECECIIDSC
jgi:hypothetical protein